MSSTNKTENLQLNSWVESDPPKRIDFNYDNEILDRVISEHHSDEVAHITAEERERWNKYIHVGLYFGNGVLNRTIETNCPFTPSFGIIFPNNRPAAITRFADAMNYNYLGFISNLGNGAGVSFADDGVNINIKQTSSPVIAGEHLYFNENGLAFVYVLFR